MRHTATRFCCLLLLPLWLGCAGAPDPEPAPPAETAVTEPEATPVPEPVPEEIEYGNFTGDQLYRILIAEIGGQRGQLEEAGEHYRQLAVSTRDLNIIRRAVQFASANEDTRALLELGLLWAEVSPEDPQPHLFLAFEFLDTGNFDQALSHMARVIDLGADVDFTALASRTGQLDRNQRGRLIASLRQLRSEFGDEPSIHLTLVQLLAQNGDYQAALEELTSLIDEGELTPLLVRLEAQILQNSGDGGGALRTLRDGVRRFPEDRAIRLGYARLLVQREDYATARDQFRALVETDSEDWETWYSLGLLEMELDNYDSAEDIFERLTNIDERADQSHYYLGVIHEEQGENGQAVEHYRQVRIGTNNYLAAQQQATRLAIEMGDLAEAHSWLINQSRGQPRLEILFTTIESNALIQAGYTDAARELLDTALNKHPNDVDLLFARVLLNDNLGNREASERDLRQIIRMQPENAQALNHLGYMLADQTARYEEALELIERAIAVEPDDPAIIDSLGWAQYKLGRLEEALRNLRRAYADFPNHEVASHVGEVLWKLGREDEAMVIWEEGLESEPDSPIIREAMDRLLPD